MDNKKDNYLKFYFNSWLNQKDENKGFNEFYKDILSQISDLNKIEIYNLIENLPKSNTISRRQALLNIKESFKNDNLVLVLGAGVSIDFGVPSWNTLLQDLMVYTIEKDNKISTVISKLFNIIFSPNPLIAARYLQDYFENNNESFEKMVRDVLYKNVNKDVESKLMDEIVKLCVAPGKSPNIDSIITYNFDDILEYKLQKTKLDIPFKSIFGLGMDVKKDILPIYHVHGFLPESEKASNLKKITFGEINYHDQYIDIYSWNNIVQINKFRDNTCLFIGSSLTDPNTRRLLDIALKQKGNKRKHHYIFKKRIDKNYISSRLKAVLNDKNIINEKNNAKLSFEETINILTDIYERFEENDSASFGVQTIWIKDWDEIPKVLKDIREYVA